MKKNFSNNNDQMDIAVIAERVANIDKKVDEINIKLDAHYVTKDEFEPIRMLVYGMAGLILTGVVIALISLVLKIPK